MSSIAIQVFMVKLLLSGLIFLLSISTLWYALVVYYEPDSLIKRPLQCISETLLLQDHVNVNDDEINNTSTIIDDFWLDKLALLGAKRAGSVLFWDDAVDLSLLLSPSSSSSSTKTIDENRSSKKKRQLLERVAENCGLEFLVQKQDDENDNEIWTLISNRTILDHPLLISSSSLPSSSSSSWSWSWWSWMVPRYSQLPGTFTFKAHIRFCRRGSTTSSSIRCPSFVHVDENDKDKEDEDILSINDVLPTDKDCLVSGASTRCPRHVDKILLQEFGEKWKSDLLLNFRKQHRRV